MKSMMSVKTLENTISYLYETYKNITNASFEFPGNTDSYDERADPVFFNLKYNETALRHFNVLNAVLEDCEWKLSIQDESLLGLRNSVGSKFDVLLRTALNGLAPAYRSDIESIPSLLNKFRSYKLKNEDRPALK